MTDALTKLKITKDQLTSIVNDIDIVIDAVVGNDVTTVRMMLRYFQHIRSATTDNPTNYKHGIVIAVCAIIESYLKERNETEV